jgi:hypothetical protein
MLTELIWPRSETLTGALAGALRDGDAITGPR